MPVPEACSNGICYQLDITLNGENFGIIRYGKTGRKMDNVKNKKFIDAIGEKARPRA